MTAIDHTILDQSIVCDQIPKIFYRPAQIDDVERIHALESSSYPEDEAASLERLQFRIEHGKSFH